MSNLDLQMIITALDKASAPVKQIQEAVSKNMDKATGSTKKTQEAFNSAKSALSGFQRAGQALQSVSDGMRNITDHTRNLFDIMGRLNGMVQNVARTFNQEFIETASQFERYIATLSVLERSSSKAAEQMQKLKDFAELTPFEIDEATRAFIQLRTVGLDPWENDMFKTFGDVATVFNKPLTYVTDAIKDAMVGRNLEVEQLGISVKADANKITYDYTNKDGQRIVKQIKNDREEIKNTLLSIWKEMYGGSMEKLGGSWSIMSSNVGDAWKNFKLLIMDAGPFDFLKEKLSFLLGYWKELKDTGYVQWMATRAGDVITRVLKGIWELGVKLKDEFKQLPDIINNLYEKFRQFISSLGVKLPSFKKIYEDLFPVFTPLPGEKNQKFSIIPSIGKIAGIGGLITALGGLAVISPYIIGIAKAFIDISLTIGSIARYTPALLSLSAVLGLIVATFKVWGKRNNINLDFNTILSDAFKAWETFKNWILGIFQAIYAKFQEFTQGFAEGFLDTTGNGNNLYKILKELWKGITELSGPLRKVFKEFLATVDWKGIGKALGTLSGILTQIGLVANSVVVVGLVAALSGIIWLLWQLIKLMGKVSAFLGYFSVVIEGLWRVTIWPFLVRVWEGVKTFGGNIITAVNQIFSDPDWILTVLTYFFGDTGKLIYDIFISPGLEAFRSFIKLVTSILNGDSWKTIGMNLLQAIIDGLLSAIPGLRLAMTEISKIIDSYLPHSPAKEGPLKDLNKIRLIQTIADTITPEPLITSLSDSLDKAMNSFNNSLSLNYAFTGVPVNNTPGIANNNYSYFPPVQKSNNVTIHYSPQIKIAGEITKETSLNIENMLKQHSYELMKLWKAEKAKEERTKY